MTTPPDTLISIIQQRHSRIKSASARADIGLFDFGDCYVCYDDDADKVNTWLKGTGLCKHTELSTQVWEFSLCECSIPLASMDKAVDLILGHASVALVGHVTERNIPKYIMIKFLKRTAAAVKTVEPVAWNPIETAPKDGRYILLASPSGYSTTPLRAEVCRYDEKYRPRQPWVNHSNDSFLDGGEAPTCWMPMPTPIEETDPLADVF